MHVVENTGSTARDFCMLERNFLSHLKLALLMSLLASSVLLRARLPEPSERSGSNTSTNEHLRLPMASLTAVSSLCVIGIGLWEFNSGASDLKIKRAFLRGSAPHLAIISCIACIILVFCIVLLVQDIEF